jgi:transaldolase/glucose-6-phosphate isomerase
VARSKIEFALGKREAAVNRRVGQWKSEHFTRRLWDKDPALWGQTSPAEIENRLGWLDLPSKTPIETDRWNRLAREIDEEGFTDIVLIGMGGSSLAPEVFASTLAPGEEGLRFHLCDTTHPAAISALEGAITPDKTAFIVSSKSGKTIETLSLFHYFYARIAGLKPEAGRHFIAVTDPGTPLEALATERSFRSIVRGDPDVGGRFSALSAFGLFPARLAGIDPARLLPLAADMERTCGPGTAEDGNPALRLGAALGELTLAGLDKVTFLASQSLKALPVWIEQLIAESTGKDGKGILPVVGERASAPDAYSKDRVFVHHALAEEENVTQNAILRSVEARGFPVVRIILETEDDLGAEMYRWEVAIAAACAVLSVHPFNQPDVEGAKRLAREAMDRSEGTGDAKGGSAGGADGLAIDLARDPAASWRGLDRLLAKRRPGDYIALQAYLEPSREMADRLQALRVRLSQLAQVPVTMGFGPRYLHSTGQLHKGGPDRGIFLQLVDTPAKDLPIPESEHTFRELIRAQSAGEWQALQALGRRVLRLELGAEARASLDALLNLLD